MRVCICVCIYIHVNPHTYTHPYSPTYRTRKSHESKRISCLPHISSINSLGATFFIHSRQYLPLCGHALNTTPINPQIKSNSFTEDQAHDKLEVVLELSKEKKRSEIIFNTQSQFLSTIKYYNIYYTALKIPPNKLLNKQKEYYIFSLRLDLSSKHHYLIRLFLLLPQTQVFSVLQNSNTKMFTSFMLYGGDREWCQYYNKDVKAESRR